MFKTPDDDFLDMLMSGKGDEYLDRQISKLRFDIGEEEFQKFAQDYYKNQNDINPYVPKIANENSQKLDRIEEDDQQGKIQLVEKDDKYFELDAKEFKDYQMEEIIGQTFNLTEVQQKIKKVQKIQKVQKQEEQNIEGIQPSEQDIATCSGEEEDQCLKQISRSIIQGTNKYRIEYSNGDQYEGQVDGQQKNGWGTYRYGSGDKYDGCFIEDQIHGYGHYFFASGAEYQGDWSSGMRHGIGILKLPNKDKYEGMFCRDQFHGNGIYKSYFGDIFEGQWKNGKKHGKGRLDGADGVLMIGNWIEGQFSV